MAKHKGQFKKGGGRIGDGRSHRGHAKTRTKTIVKTKTRTVHAKAKRRGHRRHGGGVGLMHLAVAGGALAFLAGDNSPVAAIKDNAAKIPGAKSFGAPAMLGAVALGVDKLLWRNRWLRAAGYAGIAYAALAVGTKGKNFQFLGDAAPQQQLRGPEDFDGDVEGIDDEDVEGDDYDDE